MMPGRDLSAELFGNSQTTASQHGIGRDLSAQLFPSAPDEKPGFLDKLRGAAETAVSLGTGATSGAIGYIGGALGGIAGSIANGDFGTEKGIRGAKDAAEAAAARYTYTPTSKVGQQYTQNVTDALNDSGIQGLPVGPEMATVAGLAGPAAAQVRNALSTDVFAARNLASKAAGATILPKIEPNRAALLQKAVDAGFTVTPDMMTDNRFVKILTDTFRKVPLSGSSAETNQAVFNNNIIKAIGGDKLKTKLTSEVFHDAMNKSGEAIGEIAEKTPIPLDDSLQTSLAKNAADAASFHTDDVSKIVGNYVGQIQQHAAENGGIIDGTFMRRVNSQLGRQARTTTNGDLKSALDGLHDDLLGAMQKNIQDPADISAFNQARQQYAIGKTVEPLVAKSMDGDISPASLMGRVTANSAGKTAMAQGNAGPLGDLARIGQLLKEPNSSNTAERGLAYGLMGGGAIANPMATAGVYAGANAYNRLSPLLAKRIVKNSLPEVVPPVRFPAEPMALVDESAWPPRTPIAAPVKPYTGLLSLADGPMPTRNSGVPDSQRLATTHDYPTIDFPLRQEVLQQPDIVASIEAFRIKAEQLQKVANNAISKSVRDKAALDLAKLQGEFGDGMRQLGISNAADAHGLNRPLYETGNGTRLPIQSTFTPNQ